MPTIGEKIREARLQRGLTQGDLAEDLVTSSMISQIEADKAKPSYPLLTSIANRLGMPVEYFLNELEDQFTLASSLRLAEYHLLAQNPDGARVALDAVQPPMPPGLQYQEYHLMLAKICRMQRHWQESIRLIEDLRELAYRHQDRKLLLQVCKEAGYVEFDTGNDQGAMHEWKKAIDIGESFAAVDGGLTVEMRMEVAELCIAMHRACQHVIDEDKADEWIHRASAFSQTIASARQIAAALVQDAEGAIREADSGRAKNTLEKAVSILHATRWAEQSILIQSKLATSNEAPSDPWERAAVATVTADPSLYLDAELSEIERLLADGAVRLALERIERGYQLLESYGPLSPALSGWESGHRIRLVTAHAQAHSRFGEKQAAIKLLMELGETLRSEGLERQHVRVMATLLTFASDYGDTELAISVSNRIQTWFEQN